jgi:hypothetical protein
MRLMAFKKAPESCAPQLVSGETFEEFGPTHDFFDYSVLQKHTEKEFTMN